MDSKAATILIIAGGSKPDLFECLHSLCENSYSPTNTVVFDNSPDGLGGEVSLVFPKVSVTRVAEPLTFAAAVNVGLRDAFSRSARVVLLLNDDVTVHRSCLAALIRAREEYGPGLYAPEIHPYEPGGLRTRFCFDWSRRLIARETAEQCGPVTPIDYAEGSAVLISAEVYEKIGGFDEDFGFYFEDADYSLRALDAGFRVVEVRSARVWHKSGASAGRGLSPFKAYYRARNTLRFAAKYSDRARFPANAVYHFAGFVLPQLFLSLAKAAVGSSKDAAVAANIARGTWDYLTGNGRAFRPQCPRDDALLDTLAQLKSH